MYKTPEEELHYNIDIYRSFLFFHYVFGYLIINGYLQNLYKPKNKVDEIIYNGIIILLSYLICFYFPLLILLFIINHIVYCFIYLFK